MKNQLILKDGKFWRDGKEVSPRIGDTEQIALLKAEEKRAERAECKANGEGLEVEINIVRIHYDTSFTCICGNEVHERFTCSENIQDIEDLEEYCRGYSAECRKCHRKYVFSLGGVKLIKV